MKKYIYIVIGGDDNRVISCHTTLKKAYDQVSKCFGGYVFVNPLHNEVRRRLEMNYRRFLYHMRRRMKNRKNWIKLDRREEEKERESMTISKHYLM
jgi:hypothetical protein